MLSVFHISGSIYVEDFLQASIQLFSICKQVLANLYPVKQYQSVLWKLEQVVKYWLVQVFVVLCKVLMLCIVCFIELDVTEAKLIRNVLPATVFHRMVIFSVIAAWPDLSARSAMKQLVAETIHLQ